MELHLVPQNDPDTDDPYVVEVRDDLYDEAVNRFGKDTVHAWIIEGITRGLAPTEILDKQHRET